MPNYGWSEPESHEPLTYSNEFGEVLLEPVTDFMPVSEIDSRTLPAINNVLMTVEEAEQVNLITENRRACMSSCFPFREGDRNFFAVKYICRNRAAVCRCTIQRFATANGMSAQEQIEDMAPKVMGPLLVF